LPLVTSVVAKVILTFFECNKFMTIIKAVIVNVIMNVAVRSMTHNYGVDGKGWGASPDVCPPGARYPCYATALPL